MHFSKLAVASALALGASATPFALLTLRSGTDLQFRPVVDNNLSLAVGRDTSTVPPPSFVSGAAFTNTTLFSLADDGTLSMAIGGTGIQYVWVSLPTGLAQVTAPHVDSIPGYGESNFTIVEQGGNSFLKTVAGDAYACNTGPYDIFFGVAALSPTNNNCRLVDLLVEYLPEGTVGAWEYD